MTLERPAEFDRVVERRGGDAVERAAITVPAFIFEDRAPRGDVRRLLQAAVEGRRDGVARRERLGAMPAHHFGADHFRHVRCFELNDRAVHPVADRRGHRGVVLRPVDRAGLDHPAKHVGPAIAGTLHARDRVVRRRRARQACQQGSFRQCQLTDGLVEIDF